MSRQRVWILATSVVAAGLGAAALLIWGGYSTTPTLLGVTLAVTLAVGWSFSVLGVIAAVYWPSSRTGLLMIGVGLAWFARAVGAVDSPVMFSAGVLIGSLYLAVLVHLMVTYPTGRLVSRGQRLVVAAAYLCTIPLNFVGHWLLPGSGTCRDCRFNLLTTSGQTGAPDAGHLILFVLLVCVTLAVLVFMAARWHAASPVSRRSLAPPLWGALTILGVVAAHRIGTILHLTGPASTVLAWLPQAVLVLWPIGFVVGMARTKLDQSTVADLVVELDSGLPSRGMRAALSDVLHDPSLQLALWLPDRQVFVDENGRDIEAPSEGSGRAVTTLRSEGNVVAVLTHDPSLADHPALISAVAAAAGIALDNERLHQQAQAHLVEARASRTRLVATADAERRRVERNLHDGAQQRMLNLMLALRLAKVRLGGEAYDETADALEEATEQLTLALSELRDLARGIHPAILSESGLGPALRALAQRCSVHVRITDTLNGQRFGTGVEETAYFVVSEALANVAKHACVSEAAVGIRRTGQALLVDVTDDGIGGATLQQGEGLRGLQDRVEAYSGHLTVDSPAGHGTHIRAELPCA